MILCEKPLAMNTAEGEEMVTAVEKAGVPNMVWYNYRRIPAVTMIKQIVASGKLGRIFHYRANFLQDWTINADVPQGGAATWRLDVEAAGDHRARLTTHTDDVGKIDMVTAIGDRSSVPFVDHVLGDRVSAAIEEFNPYAARDELFRLHDEPPCHE